MRILKNLSLILITIFVVGACVSKRTYLNKEREVKVLQQQMESEIRERQRIIRKLLDLLDQQIIEGNISMNEFRENIQKELYSTTGDLKSAQAAAEAHQKQLEEMRSAYQQLLTDFKREIDDGLIRVHTQGRGFTVNFVDRILFASGSEVVTPAGREILGRVAQVLKGLNFKEVQIQGHADNQRMKSNARFPSNWELAANRATGVTRFLIDNGLNPVQMGAVSYSEYRPIASNVTESGRQLNRRIEIVVIPNDYLEGATPQDGLPF